MSYWEDRYIDYLAEEDGQLGGDSWREDYNPRASLEKKLSFKYVETLCPECGGQMISRTGQYGTFWGCKKFPDCKGTRDSNGDSKYDRVKEKGEIVEESEPMKEIRKFTFNKKI